MDGLKIVVNVETDEPELLGTFRRREPESGEVVYNAGNDDLRAPADCVVVVDVPAIVITWAMRNG